MTLNGAQLNHVLKQQFTHCGTENAKRPLQLSSICPTIPHQLPVAVHTRTAGKSTGCNLVNSLSIMINKVPTDLAIRLAQFILPLAPIGKR